MDNNVLDTVDESALAVNDTPPTPAPNASHFSLNAQIKFLGTDLAAVLEKTSTKDEAQKCTTNETEILVIPTDTDTQGIKLVAAIRDINTLIQSFSNQGEGTTPSISAEDVQKQMEQLGLKVFENITLELRQVFLHQDTVTKTIDGGQPTDVSKFMEYAINVNITNILTLPPDFQLFNIKSVGLAVWKTNNQKVLDRMKIADIKSYLAK